MPQSEYEKTLYTKMRSELLKRNLGWAKDRDPSKWTTALQPNEEKQFRDWLKKNKSIKPIGLFKPDDKMSDYDMRGYWKGMTTGTLKSEAGMNPYTNTVHFPDTFKTPYHSSFSNESIYANPDAPRWVNNELRDKDGRLIHQDKREH